MTAELETIAAVVHEAIRAYSVAIGQEHIPAWEDAPAWMHEATLAGVRYRLEHPGAPSSAQHEQWMAQKTAAGWQYGEAKDEAKKTHPMMVPYDALPEEEKLKDALFAAIVSALSGEAG